MKALFKVFSNSEPLKNIVGTSGCMRLAWPKQFADAAPYLSSAAHVALPKKSVKPTCSFLLNGCGTVMLTGNEIMGEMVPNPETLINI